MLRKTSKLLVCVTRFCHEISPAHVLPVKHGQGKYIQTNLGSLFLSVVSFIYKGHVKIEMLCSSSREQIRYVILKAKEET